MYMPREISTDEKILKIKTFNGVTFLCNLKDIKLSDLHQIKEVHSLINFNWSYETKDYLIQREKDKFEHLCMSHNWGYEYGTHNTFITGTKSRQAILDFPKEHIGEDFYKETYNKYAPEALQIK